MVLLHARSTHHEILFNGPVLGMREQTEWTPRQSYGTRLSQISIALNRIRYARHSHQDPPIQLSIRFPFWRSQSARAPPSPHSFIRGAPPTRSDPLIVLNQARVSLKACEQGFAGKNTTGNELKPGFKGSAASCYWNENKGSIER